MQVYNGGEQSATNNERAAQDLDGEKRRQARGILRGLDALKIEDSIARAERREPDAAGRTWRIGAHVGKMCRQLVYWEDKSEDPDYRVHKTARDWFESEAGITRGHLRTATRIAVDEGLLTVEPGYRSDRRQTNYYRLNMWNLFRTVVASDLENIERQLEHEGRKYRRDTLNRRRRALESALNDLNLLETGDSANPQSEVHGGQFDHGGWLSLQPTPVNLHPLQENRQENTPIDFPPGGEHNPPQKGMDQKNRNDSNLEETTTSPHKPNKGAKSAAAKARMTRFAGTLKKEGVPLDEDDSRRAIQKNLTLCVEKEGATDEELGKVAEHIALRRSEGVRLYPLPVLRDDIRGKGKPRATATPEGFATPPAGIEALKNYYGEKTGATDLRAYVGLAKRWDFTSEEKPDWRIMNELSRDRGEQERYLKRLQNVTRRAVREAKDEAREEGMAKMGTFNDPENPAVVARMDSPVPEGGPEVSSTTPEDAEGDAAWRAMTEAVDKLQADPDSKAARLARAVVEGRRSPQGPITEEDVKEAAVDELDMDALGAGTDGLCGGLLVRQAAAIVARKLIERYKEAAA